LTANADDFDGIVSDILEEHDAMVEMLRDIAREGTLHDLTPTKLQMMFPIDSKEFEQYMKNEMWWTHYLKSADDSVRARARTVLERFGYDTRH